MSEHEQPAPSIPPETMSSPVPKVSRTSRRGQPNRRHRQRAMDAGRTDRLTADWPNMPLTADEIVRRNYLPLVARGRDALINNSYGTAFVRIAKQNIVGPNGVILQSKITNRDGELDDEANRAVEKQFKKWGKRSHCTVTGTLSWRDIERSAISDSASIGEFMFHEVIGDEAGEWGYTLQVLDPVRCPIDLDKVTRANGNFIRHGIEFTQIGRPAAYYFTMPDGSMADFYYAGRSYRRIPADQIIHGFDPVLVGQKRGLSWMGAALVRLKMLHEFDKSALVNARIGASKSGFLTWKEGAGPQIDHDEDEELEIEVEPGTFHELPPGMQVDNWDPTYPNGEMVPFQKSMLRGAATGMGVAYNTFASDLEGVNFSSIRQGALDERDHWKTLQVWLIECLHERVYKGWLKQALLRDKIKVNGKPLPFQYLEKYIDESSWQPRRWAWIDPRADVDASIKSLQNMLAAPGDLISETGRDPEEVWRQIASNIKRMKEFGIPEDYIVAAFMGKASTAKKPAKEDDDDEVSAADRALMQLVGQIYAGGD